MPKYVACIQYRGNGPQQNSLLIVEAANEDQAAALLDLAMDHANLLDLLSPGETPRICWSWNRLKELDGMAVMRKQEERKNRRTPHQLGRWSGEACEAAIGTAIAVHGVPGKGCPSHAKASDAEERIAAKLSEPAFAPVPDCFRTTDEDAKVRECEHKNAKEGPRVPVLYGSRATLVCPDCGGHCVLHPSLPCDRHWVPGPPYLSDKPDADDVVQRASRPHINPTEIGDSL